ncbi:ATP-dependent DNA ligase [Nitzschia inconspicua]|uniref:DNA ligase n=1 Tax=Nitzschia inconspicua TaxID=303405 RepID=A0A9K3PHY3_9STRA|nr:ATP-dependent DNA ligase [Nitzschia inconspicua]
MPKQQQSSLDSFFGVQKNKVKQQKTINSFFKDNSKNKENDDNAEVKVGIVAKKRSSPSQQQEAELLNKKRRPVIEDSDSEEEEENGIDNNQNLAGNAATASATATATKQTTKTETGVKATSTRKIEDSDKDMEDSKPKASFFAPTKPIVPKECSNNNAAKNESGTGPAVQPVSPSFSSSTVIPLIEPTQDTPQRRALVARAKKIAKAYKVEPVIPEAVSSPVLYLELARIFEKIEAISSRLDIQAIFTKFLRQILQFAPQDLPAAIYMACNSVAPAYECVELGIGDSLLITAIAEAYGSRDKVIKDKYEDVGDLGLVAQSAKSKQRTLGFGMKPKPLIMSQVLQVFREIANITGNASRKLKIDKIKKLLVAVQDSAETKYIIRGLQGKLRIGLAQSTVLISLGHALMMTIPATVVFTTSKEEEEESEENDSPDPIVAALRDESLPVEKTLEAAANMIRKVYSEVPSFDALLDAAIKVPLMDLPKACHFLPGIPVEPMLAKPTKSIQEVLKRLNGQEFTCEFKYDGERAQIHKTGDGKLKVFSRNLLETTGKYPEVPQFVQEAARASMDSKEGSSKSAVAVESFVMDAEVVAFNRETGQLVPFQVLSTRKKTEESAETAKVQVIVQAFDLMYLNGESLLGKTLKTRRSLLHKHFAPVEGKFQFATSLDHTEDGDTMVLEQFLDMAVKGQCEGLMVKTMDDVYEPSRRSLNWLKLKKDYLDGLGDSFDLVPIGAYHGRGKRTGVYGAYLLACYDEDSEEYQSVCKIGTGFSDEDLQTLSASLNQHKLEGGKASNYIVTDQLKCDVWFDAVQVWEVKAADLSKSSAHRGAFGKLEEDRGIGLRFPRFERLRDDKSPEQASNSDQILDMYYNQDTVKGQSNNDMDDDDGI